jgi:cytochrome c peroxidase
MRWPRRLVATSGGAAMVALIHIAVFDPPSNAIAQATEADARPLRLIYSQPADHWPLPWLDADVAFIELGRLPLPSPTGRAQQKRELGALLFRDPLLSAARNLACASCHDGDHGWSVATPTAQGGHGERGRRNPPSLFTAALHSRMNWDGGGMSLTTQSLVPLTVPDEMANADLDSVILRLRDNPIYVAGFARIYGPTPISAQLLAEVLVAFQTYLDFATRFDRFAAGEHAVLTDQEIRGLHLFRTKARCANCHFGPRLTDAQFHNLKISSFGEKAEDLGRYRITGAADDAGRFRTPSLRHVAASAPYMHNGLFATLEGVVNLYDRGGGEVWARNAVEAAHPLYPYAARLSPHLRPLGLSGADKADLVAFLRTL